MDNVIRVPFICGELIVYGDNLKSCLSYINYSEDDSVAGLCYYCKEHHLRVVYEPYKTITGLLSKSRVTSITKRYGVNSSWDELRTYLESHGFM